MKDLIIVGAGGFGREVLYLAMAINQVKKQWNIKGFINDDLHALDDIKCDYKILGKITEWVPKPNEVFAMGIASPHSKEKLATSLMDRGAVFVSLIHPRAVIQPFTTIGNGSIVGHSASIGDNVTIGNFVNIMGSMIGQDSIIGDYSTTTGFTNIASAKIGKRVFVGSHAVVLNHLSVGDDAYICAGSIVISKVKAGTKVIGYPAKKMNL